MTRQLLVLFCFFFCLKYFSFAQTPVITWQKSMGSYSGDYAYDVQATTDGGYIVAGHSENKGGDVQEHYGIPGTEDIWVVKLSRFGAIQWQKTLGNITMQTGADIRQTPDGGYIVAGSSIIVDCNGKVSQNGLDYWLVKLSPNGEIQWEKNYGGNKNEYLYGLDITSDGGFILAGHSESSDGDVTGNHGGIDYWAVKVDAHGNMQWQKCLGGSGDDIANSVCAARDGGYVIAGYTESKDGDVSSGHGLRDYWVVKLNWEGKLQWEQSLGGSSFDEAWSVQSTIEGGYIVAGYTSSNDGDVTGNHHLFGASSAIGW